MGKFFFFGFAIAAVAAFFFYWSRRSTTDTYVDKAMGFRDSAMSSAHDAFDKVRETVKV